MQRRAWNFFTRLYSRSTASSCQSGFGALKAASSLSCGLAASLAFCSGPVSLPLRCSAETKRHVSDVPDGMAWQLPARLVALHKLLIDFARVPDARSDVRAMADMLEDFWTELSKAEADVPLAKRELLLHLLAESFGHGTLRNDQVIWLMEKLNSLQVFKVLDPLAHTGYHASLLAAHGFEVDAADAQPAAASACWTTVIRRSAEETVWTTYREHTAVFLSWLPHWSEMGLEVLENFQGRVIVVLGDDGDWTGTDKFRAKLAQDWKEFARVSTRSAWPRVHENIVVYVRG